MELLGKIRQDKGKFCLLVALHLASMLIPVLMNRLGVEGMGTRNLWFIYTLFESAVLYFGADFFQDTVNAPYLTNWVLHFLVAIAIGPVFWVFGTKEIYYCDGGCIPMGGPTLLLFPLTFVENLPIILAITVIFMAVRWLETSARAFYSRRMSQKSL